MGYTVEKEDDHNKQSLYKPSGKLHVFRLVVSGVAVGIAFSAIVTTTRFEKMSGTANPKVEYVQQLVCHENHYLLRDIRPLWQRDLEQMSKLHADWDAEGAGAVNGLAMLNMERFLRRLDTEATAKVRLFPNAFGAVSLQLETEHGRIRCEMGEDVMSYFVKRTNAVTEHHSHETVDSEALAVLANSLMSIV